MKRKLHGGTLHLNTVSPICDPDTGAVLITTAECRQYVEYIRGLSDDNLAEECIQRRVLYRSLLGKPWPGHAWCESVCLEEIERRRAERRQAKETPPSASVIA